MDTEKVHSTAAVVIENREKVLEGALQECLEEIEYKALPAALVDHVNVDVAGMKVCRRASRRSIKAEMLL